ncbi:MAG: iron(III) transport system permease protein [Nitriliruptoraceae bacterium]
MRLVRFSDSTHAARVTALPAPRRAAAGQPTPAAVWLPALLVGAAVLVTPAWLIFRASAGGAATVIEVLDAEALRLLVRTLGLAITVTVACVMIAVPLAIITTRTDIPGRRVLAALVALPLVVPTFVGAYALVATFAPGGLAGDLVAWLGWDVTVPSPYGFGGAATALTLFSYPYVLLTVRSALTRLDPSQEEASRTLGVGPWVTLWRVTLPQLRPSIAAGSLLVVLYVLSDFGAVSLLRYSTFTRAIFLRYTSAFDRTPAAVLGLLLVAMTLVVLALEARLGRSRVEDLATGGGGVRRPASVLALGRWRWLAALACASVVIAALVGPVMVTLIWLARGLAAGEPVWPSISSVVHTFEAAALGAVASVLAAYPIALWSTRRSSRMARFIERAAHTGYALPGIVVALSLVFLGVRLGPLYQSRAMLVAAYVVLFLPQALGAIRTSLLQVPASVEEAARMLGDTPTRALVRAVMPVARGGAWSGGALVFLTVVKELPATLLLAPTGYDTLATRVWSATTEAFFGRASGPVLALLLVGAVPLGLLQLIGGMGDRPERPRQDPSVRRRRGTSRPAP